MAKWIGIGVAAAAALAGLSFGGYKLYNNKKGASEDVTPDPPPFPSTAPAADAAK